MRGMTQAGMSMMAVAAAVVMAATPPAVADDDQVQRRMDSMQQEIERLREDNLALRSELEEIRVTTGDNWLTEQRAEEIRSIVTDVLADADTRASLLGDGLMAGWRDGFFLTSADGRFSLNIDGQVQFRWMYSFHDNPPVSPFGTPTATRHRAGFEASRTKLAFSGHVYSRDIQYRVQGSFQRDRELAPQGGGFFLEDAWIRYHLNNEWSIRFGQFKLPFTREQLVRSTYMQAVERSIIDTNMNVGRSQGIELTWATETFRLMGSYNEGGTDNIAGPGNITGVAIPPMNRAAMARGVEYSWTVRYEHLLAGNWEQFRDFTSTIEDDFGIMLGVAGHAQRTESMGQPSLPGQNQRHTRWLGYTVDASVEFGGANLFGSFTHHYVDQPPRNINIFGVVAQAGVYITPKIEAFGRYEFGDWSTQLPPGNEDFLEPLHLMTLGVNYYIEGHDLKWTTDFGLAFTQVGRGWTQPTSNITGWRSERDDAKPQVVIRTQFQLLF